jgi:GTP-binding protein Era
MVQTAMASGQDADVLLLIVDAASPHVEKDRQMIESLEGMDGVAFLAVNKIDLVKREALPPILGQYQRFHLFHKIIPISAFTGEGVDVLLNEIMEVLPESPAYFPDEMITDQTERFLVSEMIREKVIQQSYQEIPYCTAVTVEEFKEHPERNLVVIRGTIHVERNSQKKILIGKGGQKLKRIGEAARKEIEAFLEKRVFLELWVSVEKDWTDNPRTLNELGYQ